jgi:hypothetical protein
MSFPWGSYIGDQFSECKLYAERGDQGKSKDRAMILRCIRELHAAPLDAGAEIGENASV